jgi:hypothetical protein
MTKASVSSLAWTITDVPAALRLLVAPTLFSPGWSRAILRCVAPGSLVLRYLVAAGSASRAEDSSRLREGEHRPTEIEEDCETEKDVSLPLGLLYNLVEVAPDGGRSMLLGTGKSFFSEINLG